MKTFYSYINEIKPGRILMDRIRNCRQSHYELAILVVVFILFFTFNTWVTGPSYLSDEIGYLSNAAILSGNLIDNAKAWHAGYSMVLAPLFLLLKEPAYIWQGVMVMNASFWALSFVLLSRISRLAWGITDQVQMSVALLVVLLFPSWIVISGYAFSTSFFTLIYLASVYKLLQWEQGEKNSIILYSFLVGFLYWVHPTGIAVFIASLFAVGMECFQKRKYSRFIIHACIGLFLILFYTFVVHPWLSYLAVPIGYTSRFGYQDLINPVLEILLKTAFWQNLLYVTLGQIAYLTVASVGCIAYGFLHALSEIKQRFINKKPHINRYEKQAYISFIYMCLSLLGILLMGVISLSSNKGGLTIDSYIHGRYIEMVAIVFFPIGIIRSPKKSWVLHIVGLVCITGLLLNSNANMAIGNNMINDISFWPQYFHLPPSFLIWMLIGASAILLVALLFRIKKFSVLIFLILFVFSYSNAKAFHRNILLTHSKPSSIVELVRENAAFVTGVAFNPELPPEWSGYQAERFDLYSFNFYDYHFRRMTPEKWLISDYNVFLTYTIPDSLRKAEGIYLVGQEVKSELFLIVKENGKAIYASRDKIEMAQDFNHANDWLINFRLSYDGEELAWLPTQVGVLNGHSLASTNQQGFLLYGPYKYLPQGKYILSISGNIKLPTDAWVDVVSKKGAIQHKKILLGAIDLDKPVNNLEPRFFVYKSEFKLEQAVNDLEVRFFVYKSDYLNITKYEIEQVH